MVNESTIDELTVNELRVYNYMVNEYTFNDTMVTKPTVLEKRLHIMDNYSSPSSIEFFQFAGDHNISQIYLSQDITYLLHRLDVGIFESLSHVYCLERDEWQQGRIKNID